MCSDLSFLLKMFYSKQRQGQFLSLPLFIFYTINNLKILASIQNITAVQSEAQTISYTLSCTPIGCYLEKEDGLDFRQGGVNLPSPTEPVYLPDTEIVNSIFSSNDNFSFYVGTLSNNQAINYYVDGNRFFGKHIAVVGSTGSGKSCAVARLLQNIMKINHGRNENVDSIKHSLRGFLYASGAMLILYQTKNREFPLIRTAF